jgi:FKBP-type peptidyl-prolyl cis-trans isomerase 2
LPFTGPGALPGPEGGTVVEGALDFNHLLAGKTLIFDVNIPEIQ